MVTKISAGILLYQVEPDLEFMLVHPGGPFFKKKDDASWSIPKGEIDPAEDPETAARREFKEEIGVKLTMPGIFLEQITQKGGKQVFAWACECDSKLRHEIEASNIEELCEKFELEWPPRSGKKQWFAEIDMAKFFSYETARTKINPGQVPFLDRLLVHLKETGRL
ncbi:MAG: NUDIX domain-containing protein [Candidatus Obscuribacterales bacterium]|nr:NUDIX domain-containing protein [Candidatus Obscuribacterales bacterium]